MNPRATPVRVCTKPGVARMQAVEPSLEILVVVDKMDYLSLERGKADGLMLSEGSSPEHVKARWAGHHRGLRSGHVFIGVTRKLGRSDCLLAGKMPEEKGYRKKKSPGAGRWLLPESEPETEHKVRGAGKVSMNELKNA